MSSSRTATIWNESGWPEYYETHRRTTKEVYTSEWFFLKDIIRSGVSVLDVGCALGGLASIIGEHVNDFTYTGVDISDEMIERARKNHPTHRFHVVTDTDLAVLGDHTYDVVVCFGVLHLNRSWRELLASSWRHTREAFIFDLRESHVASLEDPTLSYFRVDHLLSTGKPADVLPYNIINSAEARATLLGVCDGVARLQHYGYLGPPTDAAVTPIQQVMMNTYRLDRDSH